MKRIQRAVAFRGAITIILGLNCALLVSMSLNAQQLSVKGDPVEVVATASKYVPRSTTITQPGHSYTECEGDTSYFGNFSDYGSAGSVSGTANTSSHCSTTSTPPKESTFTEYRRVNYTIVKGGKTIYLLACKQTWKRSKGTMFLGALAGATTGDAATAKRVSETRGKWSECPAFMVGSTYTLTVKNASNAQLKATADGERSKLDFLSSAPLPSAKPKPESPNQTSTTATPATAKVIVTSSPSGAEIYVDRKFYGNTPSDITLPTGQHLVRVVVGGKVWSRTVQITAGKISLHAEMPR